MGDVLKRLIDCSFCWRDAKYVGLGQDGDFYCEGHKALAPGGTYKMTEEESHAQVQG